jgi:predicted AAA+ superfamily ATPase
MKLRYFYEKYPELHVVAAGSLLEFALEELSSFGVGRISSMYMYPFSFEEFLRASGKGDWVDMYINANSKKPVFEAIHKELINQFKLFLLIGGMPAVVSKYIEKQDILKCQQILSEIIVSFRSDFAKYKKRVSSNRINEIFESVVFQAKDKFVYEKAGTQLTNRQVKDALQLLIMAGLVYPIMHTAANGIPLGAEANTKFQRMFLFDTGLFQRILGLNISDILLGNDIDVINKGSIAEIYVATELIKNAPCYSPYDLYYWQREKPQAKAQVDFLIQKNENIVPVEVKSGTIGKMQSLFLFMQEKHIKFGIRTSLENFSEYNNIKVIPLYAIGKVIEMNIE